MTCQSPAHAKLTKTDHPWHFCTLLYSVVSSKYLVLVWAKLRSLLKLCKQICEVIVKYLENFNYESPVYLAEERFLSVLLDRVSMLVNIRIYIYLFLIMQIVH